MISDKSANAMTNLLIVKAPIKTKPNNKNTSYFTFDFWLVIFRMNNMVDGSKNHMLQRLPQTEM